jgi:hypothetical protein
LLLFYTYAYLRNKDSDEAKAKISKIQKGRPQPKIACYNCGKETSLVNNIRWHGDKCRYEKI